LPVVEKNFESNFRGGRERLNRPGTVAVEIADGNRSRLVADREMRAFGEISRAVADQNENRSAFRMQNFFPPNLHANLFVRKSSCGRFVVTRSILPSLLKSPAAMLFGAFSAVFGNSAKTARAVVKNVRHGARRFVRRAQVEPAVAVKIRRRQTERSGSGVKSFFGKTRRVCRRKKPSPFRPRDLPRRNPPRRRG
jgi:hypothetical protein